MITEILWIWILLSLNYNFFDSEGLQGTHMKALNPFNSKLMALTPRGGLWTFSAILALCAAVLLLIPAFGNHNIKTCTKPNAVCASKSGQNSFKIVFRLSRFHLIIKYLNIWTILKCLEIIRVYNWVIEYNWVLVIEYCIVECYCTCVIEILSYFFNVLGGQIFF